MYCLCVNVYCTTATGWQTQLQLINISYHIHTYMHTYIHAHIHTHTHTHTHTHILDLFHCLLWLPNHTLRYPTVLTQTGYKVYFQLISTVCSFRKYPEFDMFFYHKGTSLLMSFCLPTCRQYLSCMLHQTDFNLSGLTIDNISSVD